MTQLKMSSDGGIEVDTEMRSSCEYVYAAGDACTVQWNDVAFHWLQVYVSLMFSCQHAHCYPKVC